MVKWQDHIITDSNVLLGKPTIKGTRISIEFILERLANGWSEDQILENYPRLSNDDLKAVHAFTYEAFKDGLLFMKTKRA